VLLLFVYLLLRFEFLFWLFGYGLWFVYGCLMPAGVFGVVVFVVFDFVLCVGVV